ncbi:MAG: 3-phosphoshikimate 1-carboxyvinyltransferase [Candidatus Actinomarina sp.]
MRSRIVGEVNIVGDKSISHRAIILSSLASGKSILSNVLISGDTKATINIFKNLGVEINEISNNQLEIHGVGLNGLNESKEPLNALNSGTTARLLIGLLSKQKFESDLIGSTQLNKRPMSRVIDPLVNEGAKISGTGGSLPIKIQPSDYSFENIHSTKPSAQVKSSFLLASLYHKAPTTISEIVPTRDHTERMLSLMGVNIVRLGNTSTVAPVNEITSIDYLVPGDPSSAAFLIAIGLLKSKKVVIKNVLLNERRIGFLKVLKRMNADILLENVENFQNEPVGDVVVKKSKLQGVTIDGSDVVDMVDEIPIFTLLASQAEGITKVIGAQELRVKESDRLAAMENFINELDGEITTFEDGFEINGKQNLQSGVIETLEDHRIAMTAVVANICIDSQIKADNIDCISDSYPDFFYDLEKIGANYES